MHTETLDRRNMNEADAQAIAELLVRVFQRRTLEERLDQLLNQWRDYDGSEEMFPRSVVIRDGSRVIAHAAVWPRTVGTSEGDITVMALAQVATDPDMRGQRLGQAVARAAFDLVDHGPYEHALFQTSRLVRPFYEKLGCGLVTNRIVNSFGADPEKSPFEDEVVMRYPYAKPWPTGDIDLRGPGY